MQFFSVDNAKKLIDYQDKIIPEGPIAPSPPLKKFLKVSIYKDHLNRARKQDVVHFFQKYVEKMYRVCV